MQSFGIAAKVLSNRGILAAQAGFSLYSVVEHATWLTLLLYAFDRGGIGEAGIVAFALLVPAALLAPLGSAVMDRLRPDRAFAAGFGPQALSCLAIAISMSLDAAPLAVYVLGALFNAAMSLSRPTLSAALPTIADTPAELAGANSIAGFIETAGVFIGPATAGVIVVASGPATVFWVSAAALLTATALALTIKPSPLAVAIENQHPPMADEPQSLRTELTAGFALLRNQPQPRLLVLMMALTWFVFGALDVALVAIAVDQLGRSEATAGLLASAIGLGGLVGGLLSIGLAGRRRQSIPVVLGLLGIGLPVMALAATDSVIVVVLLLATVGLGDIIADVAGRTLIQGLAAEDTLARVFGILEGLGTAAVALGGIGFSSLALLAGIEVALVTIGAVVPVLLALRFGRLLSIDRARPEVDAELLAMLRRVPIFAPLPAFRVEQMIVNMDRVSVEGGQPVFHKGDDGDLLYLVADGTAEVELPGRIAVHKQGGFFGEIALLRDQPRMATVRAGTEGLVAYTLERSVFLQALGDFPRSRQRTAMEAQRRLDENGP